MYGKKSQVWVVIAAFNEASVIVSTVTDVLLYFDNVVVADDCSSDHTAELALSTGAHVLSHPINLGQGAALQSGISYAMQQGADYIVTFDADGQHDASEITPMLAALRQSGCDVVLGSRFLGKATGITRQRRLLLSAALLFTRITSGIRLTDVHNGFRVLSRNFCQAFEFRQNRMAHASEILDYIASHKVSYIEYPVTITYSEYSLSKGQRSTNAIRIVMELLMGRVSK
jgi:glycosyltransferase involved in cell wall biosynthesis